MKLQMGAASNRNKQFQLDVTQTLTSKTEGTKQ